MNKIKTSFAAGAVCEVKRFNYDLGGFLMAEIEVMVYSETEFRVKARMYPTGRSFELRETYPTIKQAVESIVAEIEKTISEDHGLGEIAS